MKLKNITEVSLEVQAGDEVTVIEPGEVIEVTSKVADLLRDQHASRLEVVNEKKGKV